MTARALRGAIGAPISPVERALLGAGYPDAEPWSFEQAVAKALAATAD